MKCYTFHAGDLYKGVASLQDEKFGPIVFLGSKGPGAQFKKISLDRNLPAEIVNSTIFECYPKPVTLPKKEGELGPKSFVVLSKPTKKTRSFLLRVCGSTKEDVPDSSVASWEVVRGDAKLVTPAQGRFENGAAYCDDLVALADGDAIRILPLGLKHYIIMNNGGSPSLMTPEEWERWDNPVAGLTKLEKEEPEEPSIIEDEDDENNTKSSQAPDPEEQNPIEKIFDQKMVDVFNSIPVDESVASGVNN